ncbi:Lrp/AsnC family transcriptional regulator [Pseudomonas sp. R37(2017)]|uniref:Lrp/AsnC family transcriptional regulator n=1 Tax=Pseudomonas sp. R37(2017) TaxID=1981685 RepID=UPI000A1E59FF|nr:Lrp/AsnC family transcriptional regulator [Pseudomonas sp. R37(2017)]
MNLDHFDMALLSAVQRDASTSQLDLGERVNLSSAAVNRRLKKMSAEGVIQGTVAKVNAELLGYTLTVITEVEVENERLDLLDEMKKAFLDCPQVQQCYYVAGECDFVLIMLVKNMEQYTQLTRQLFFENNNVKRFKTLVSMSNVKTGMFVPTPASETGLADPRYR